MWLYIFSVLTVLMNVLIAFPMWDKLHHKRDAYIIARMSREQREDADIDALEARFVNDEITMEELAAGTEAILTGKSLPDPMNHESRGFLLMPPPKPIDAARSVRPPKLRREYSYPAAVGWPETDPPHPGYVCGTCHKSVDRLVPTKGICHNCDKAFSKAQQQWGYNPPKMSSDGHTLCTKDAGGYPRTSVCGCPDCMGTEEFYEALENMNDYDYRKKEFVA